MARLGRGVGLSFAAWPAGWVPPSQHGRGVGLLWAVVVAGLTGAGGCTDLRKEKKNSWWLSLHVLQYLFIFLFFSEIIFWSF